MQRIIHLKAGPGCIVFRSALIVLSLLLEYESPISPAPSGIHREGDPPKSRPGIRAFPDTSRPGQSYQLAPSSSGIQEELARLEAELGPQLQADMAASLGGGPPGPDGMDGDLDVPRFGR